MLGMWLQKTYVLEKSVRVLRGIQISTYNIHPNISPTPVHTANRKVVALDMHFFIMAFDSARFSANWAGANRPWADLTPFIFVVHQRFADCSKRNCQAMHLAALSRHPSYEVLISPCCKALQQGRPNKNKTGFKTMRLHTSSTLSFQHNGLRMWPLRDAWYSNSALETKEK